MCFGGKWNGIRLVTQMLSKKIRRLSFKEKCGLIKEVKSGASKQSILNKYGICEETYKRVLARESYLMNMAQDYEFAKKKSSKTSADTALDAAVLKWFQEKRARGDPISGPILREKALQINENLNCSKTFKASKGWLSKFKRRHGIRNVRIKGEKLSNDSSSAAEFSTVFKEKIESKNLNLNNIYNADESGILWRALTACTLALHSELEVPGRKECKDRVTALFCANVTGSHRIPLLTIGKYQTPRCLSDLMRRKSKDLRLKNWKSLGVIYTHQKSAWMDKCIFMLWYKDSFIPRVLEYQRTHGITGKVVLLVDNAPSHPSLDELNAINENFEVVYLPPNVTALIQPMDQRIIATTKKLYKKSLLRRLLLSEKSEGAIKFLNGFNLRDCLSMLRHAWDDVQSSALQKAWKPLLGDLFLFNALANIQDALYNVSAVVVKQESSTDMKIFSDDESENDLPGFPYEICDQVSEMLSNNQDYSAEQSREFLLKWFENDQKESDWGYDSSLDFDFKNFPGNVRCEPVPVNEIEKHQAILEDSKSMEITSSEALDCLLKFKNWLKSRAECLPKHVHYIKEFEDLMSKSTTSQISQNKMYLRL